MFAIPLIHNIKKFREKTNYEEIMRGCQTFFGNKINIVPFSHKLHTHTLLIKIQSLGKKTTSRLADEKGPMYYS